MEGSDSFRRELTQLETPPEQQRKGFALALLCHLENVEPIAPLINSPTEMNTAEGIATVAAARQKGIAIHDFGCYRNGLGCTCTLRAQSS